LTASWGTAAMIGAGGEKATLMTLRPGGGR
jgi:hypothetical protein